MRNLYKTKFIHVVTWMMGISTLILFVTIYAVLPILNDISDVNYILVSQYLFYLFVLCMACLVVWLFALIVSKR